MTVTTIIISIVALIAGGGIGWVILSRSTQAKRHQIIKEAKIEAEVIKKDKILQAKERFLQLKSEHEKEINNRNNKANQRDNNLKERQTQINQRAEEANRGRKEVAAAKQKLEAQQEIVARKGEELEKLTAKQIEQLETISNLSAEDAKKQLIESLVDKAKTEAMS